MGHDGLCTITDRGCPPSEHTVQKSRLKRLPGDIALHSGRTHLSSPSQGQAQTAWEKGVLKALPKASPKRTVLLLLCASKEKNTFLTSVPVTHASSITTKQRTGLQESHEVREHWAGPWG